MTIILSDISKHVKDRKYMSGVERDKLRTKQTEEVFTPDWLAEQTVDDFLENEPTAFDDPTSTFIDPYCGDGQFLGEILIRKIKNSADFEAALSSIYGVDIMSDNVDLCRERLLCGQEHLRHIVNQNIVCADAHKYHYRFDGTDSDVSDQDLHNQDIGLFAPEKLPTQLL